VYSWTGRGIKVKERCRACKHDGIKIPSDERKTSRIVVEALEERLWFA